MCQVHKAHSERRSPTPIASLKVFGKCALTEKSHLSAQSFKLSFLLRIITNKFTQTLSLTNVCNHA